MDTHRLSESNQVDRHIEVWDLDPNPFKQFAEWYDAAQELGLPDSNAMILATATRDGEPSARTVLLKGYDEQGLVFFTNYESHKGRELAENPRAAIVFYWHPQGRQIRVTGSVERVSQEESFDYFSTRYRGSRIGAWASRQSEPLATRQELLDRVRELEERYPDDDIPLPPHWGGYRVIPDMFEFWEGRESRLHDRFRYCLKPDGTWAIRRLQP
jgi:pyridoxamine 5'-phosphate oxidase